MDDHSIRKYIDEHKWYAPIDFGNEIVTLPWNWPDAPRDTPQMGISRFNYILARNLPNLQGKRILDLGCNAGIMSIHMARLGAREVVAVDSNRTWQGWLEQARFLKEALEWRCGAKYNVKYVEADMRDVPTLDLGAFDIVIALCCLYYLTEDDMCGLTRYLSDNTKVFLVQGNTIRNDHRADRQLKRRAHPRFISRMLRENGFPFVEIDSPWRYGRPVVVGHKDEPVPCYRNRFAETAAGVIRQASYLPWLVEQRLRGRPK